jgi:hypothetical protein
MAIKKQQKDYTEIISALSDMSQKDYRDAWRISRQYRKANKMLERTLTRQERQFTLPSKSNSADSTCGLKYEMA